MRLTVLSVAYPLAPVGFDATGGAEQILTSIDDELVRHGHCSIVIACAGSRCRGTLVAIRAPPSCIDADAALRAQAECRAAIARMLEVARVDLVHLHGIDFHAYLPSAGPPVLVTLHLPVSWYPPEALSPARERIQLVCVSEAQRRTLPPGLAPLDVVDNGISLEPFARRTRRRSFALALGRICPEKGFHLALDAARRARHGLVLAGRIFGYEAHRRYFDEEIAPRLDSARCYVGPVGFEQKRRLLAEASCLLVPSLVPETSSLVAMEALASGTPVIAFPAGALEELVEHGKTGFLVRSVQEMAQAILDVDRLSSMACRRVAEERFSAKTMVQRYLELYRCLLDRGPAERSSTE